MIPINRIHRSNILNTTNIIFINILLSDVFHRANEERRISELLRPVRGQYMARYDVLHPRGEMRRSSAAQRDTTFFVRAPRYDRIPLSRRYYRV